MKIKNINFKIIITSIVTSIFLVYAPVRITCAISNTIKINISNKVTSIKLIKDIRKTVSRNVTFALRIRDSIDAEFIDGSHKKVPIVWGGGISKSNKTGVYYQTYYGSVKGYYRKVKLTVIFK